MPQLARRSARPLRAQTVGNHTLHKDQVIGGGQGQFITLGTANYAFDTISNIFSLDATVQNDLGQPLGTPDGSTVSGIKIFVLALYATSGTGAVYVANADGTGDFTASNQPYWLYNQMLASGQVSTYKTWQIYIAPTVEDFYLEIETYAAFPAEYTTPATAPDTTPDSVYAASNITNADPHYEGRHLMNVVTVDFGHDTAQADRAIAIAAIGGTIAGGWDYIANDGFYLVRVPGDSTGAGLSAAIATLQSLSQVATATPEFIIDSSTGNDYRRPNDHFGPTSWHWNPYQPTDTNWAFERDQAPLAWGCDTGSTTTQVAVVDGQFMQLADIDTNAVGSVPWVSTAPGVDRHGTAVTSILAAQGNNGIGMAGMMWRARLRLYSRDIPSWSTSRDIHLIAQAARDSARVISLSGNAGLGQNAGIAPHDSTDTALVHTAEAIRTQMDTALPRADSQSLHPVYVVSAGNNGVNPYWNVYPTIADLFPGRVLIVEATDSLDHRRFDSNFGQRVNIAAPGTNVASLDRDGSVKFFNQTSAATPQVSGTAGLLLAFNPNLSSTTVVNFITQGALNGGRHTNDSPAISVLNAYEALKLAGAQTGAPLCGNRVWSTSGNITVQRASGSEVLTSVGSPAWNVTVMHGGHRFEYTTVHGRYSVQYTGTGWGTPVQVEDSLTALSQAPFSGPAAGGGMFASSPLGNGDTTASHWILGGTSQSVWGYNHDGDSAIAAIQVAHWGSSNLDSVIVIRGASSAVLADSGQLDTVGVVTYASVDTVDYGCGTYEYGVCIQNYIQPTRVDFVRVAYSPRGDRILLAIDHDGVGVALTGHFTYYQYQLPIVTIDIRSGTVDAYAYSLPSKTRSSLTIPSGSDIWWWGISEADSTIVAGLGIRDMREATDSTNPPSGQTVTDYTTGCSVVFRSGSFASLDSIPTTDACSSLFTSPAIWGSGSISPDRIKRAPPNVVMKSSRHVVRARPLLPLYVRP